MTTPAKDKDATDSGPGAAGIARGEPDPTRPSDPANPDDSLVVSDKQIRDKGVHYARSGQIRQALGELRNARAYGNKERERAAKKTLAAQGFDLEAHERGQRQSTAEDKPVDARRQPPEGRSATPPGTVRAQAPTSTASAPSAGTGTSTQATPAKATPASPPPGASPGVTAKTEPPKGK